MYDNKASLSSHDACVGLVFVAGVDFKSLRFVFSPTNHSTGASNPRSPTASSSAMVEKVGHIN